MNGLCRIVLCFKMDLYLYLWFWCLCYRELPDLDVLAQTLCLSRSVLLKDPCQLASQLLGRVLHITAQDKPVAPGIVNRQRC